MPGLCRFASAPNRRDCDAEYIPNLSHLPRLHEIPMQEQMGDPRSHIFTWRTRFEKIRLAGAAAFVMMTGAAFAQGMSSESSTSIKSTTSRAPTVGTPNSSETRQSSDSNGNTGDKSSSYKKGTDGSKATSSSRTTSPDDAEQSISHEKTTDPPAGGAVVTKKSTTSTIDR